MYNKKHCDGERSVVVTFCTQAMFFFNGKRVKENRKVHAFFIRIHFIRMSMMKMAKKLRIS